MIEIQLHDTEFQERFGDIITKAKNPRAILLTGAREASNLLRRHFTKKERSEPNRLSPRRSHFWDQVRQSVNNSYLGSDNKDRPVFSNGGDDKTDPDFSGSNSVVISINHPAFAQKLFGGVITAKNADALTIPEEERAYGRTARTFEAETGLKLFIVKIGGSKANALENAVLAAAENGHITVEYLLTKSVNQKPDDDALPSRSELETAILSRAQKTLDRQIGSKKADSEDV